MGSRVGLCVVSRLILGFVTFCYSASDVAWKDELFVDF